MCLPIIYHSNYLYHYDYYYYHSVDESFVGIIYYTGTFSRKKSAGPNRSSHTLRPCSWCPCACCSDWSMWAEHAVAAGAGQDLLPSEFTFHMDITDAMWYVYAYVNIVYIYTLICIGMYIHVFNTYIHACILIFM